MKNIFASILVITGLGVDLLQAQYNDEPSQGIFKKHKGEILFSSKEIDLATYSGQDMQSSFDLLDELCAQIIMEKTLAPGYKENNYVNDFGNSKYTYNYALRLIVDGNKKSRWLFELPENYFDYALTFDLVLSSNNPKEKRKNSDFVNG